MLDADERALDSQAVLSATEAVARFRERFGQIERVLEQRPLRLSMRVAVPDREVASLRSRAAEGDLSLQGLALVSDVRLGYLESGSRNFPPLSAMQRGFDLARLPLAAILGEVPPPDALTKIRGIEGLGVDFLRLYVAGSMQTLAP